MNTEVKDTKVDYVWQREGFDNQGDYASSICTANGIHQFCAVWNPISQTGYLGRWSPTSSKWMNLGGNFRNPIGQMCVDRNGNIYMVGDKGSNGNYVIKICNAITGQWSEADNNFNVPLTRICCNSNNEVFVTGNFTNTTGAYYIEQYSISSNSWKAVSGYSAELPIVDMCTDSGNNLFVLANNLDGSSSIDYMDTTGVWHNIVNLPSSDVFAIACDTSGNLYYNTSTTIMSYNLSSRISTNLNANVPTYSGSIEEFYLVHIDTVLYFCGYGYTGPVSTSAFAKVYSNSTWMDVTPPQLSSDRSPIIFDIASYDGKSNNLLICSNLNYVLDGAKLHH